MNWFAFAGHVQKEEGNSSVYCKCCQCLVLDGRTNVPQFGVAHSIVSRSRLPQEPALGAISMAMPTTTAASGPSIAWSCLRNSLCIFTQMGESPVLHHLLAEEVTCPPAVEGVGACNLTKLELGS